MATDASVTPEVRFASPTSGTVVARDDISDGAWVAVVDATVVAEGVVSVEILEGVQIIASFGAPGGELALEVATDGVHVFEARGLAANGDVLASDTLTVFVDPPPETGCHAMLDALGIDYSVASPRQGVADPVNVEPYFAGISTRYYSWDTPRTRFMDCQLAVRLYQLASLASQYGVTAFLDIGIYNYRCIGGGTPETRPGCTLSQHSYATAIDIFGVEIDGGVTTYTLEDDWVIHDGDTCPGDPVLPGDTLLHALACGMNESDIFQTVLTPNYDDAHRNHFHVDMIEGRSFIKSADGDRPPAH